MVIFHSYVKLPEGKLNFHPIPPGDSWLLSLVLASPILGVIPFMSIISDKKPTKLATYLSGLIVPGHQYLSLTS